MAENRTALRVLYSINGTQYILARSFAPVPFTPVHLERAVADPSGSSSSLCRYGSVSLKTCLDIICRSSPELAQDASRDFSLYVLDPLESNSASALINISNATGVCASTSTEEESRGVAVAYGLMSSALTSEETAEIMTNGTLIKQATGQEALEVVFALRETAVPKTRRRLPSSTRRPPLNSSGNSDQLDLKPLQWYSHESSTYSSGTRSLSSPDLMRDTLPSARARVKSKPKHPKQPRESTTPMTESDKLMAGDIYIGPLKKKGRPRTTGLDAKFLSRSKSNASASAPIPPANSQEVIVIDGSDDENSHSTPRAQRFESASTSTQATQPSIPVPLVQRNGQIPNTSPGTNIKPEPRDPTVLDLLTLFATTSTPSETSTPNAALLSMLNAIDSSNPQHAPQQSGNPPSPALVEALKQLLVLCAQPQTAGLPPPPSSTSSSPAVPIAMPDVVLLNKENVDPGAFRKQAEKEPVGERNSLTESQTQRLVLSSGFSNRANETLRDSALKPSASFPAPERSIRKRTLSDFMDEKEAGKGKEREKRERPRQRNPKRDSLRHYPGVLASAIPRQAHPTNYYRTALESMSSPTKPRDHDENKLPVQPQTSPSRSPPKQLPSRYQKAPASSPIRASKEIRKKYVVPAWARTSTATQPRLSEDAQRAIEEAEARKKEERKAARRRLAHSDPKSGSNTSDTASKASSSALKTPHTEDAPPEFLVPKAPDLAKGPVAACSDGPVIAFPIMTPSRSSSPPPNPITIPRTPKTPSRPRTRLTPGTEDDSLFTPIRRSGADLFGSALSQHTPSRTPPFILTSPLGNRKKAKITPTKSMLTGKRIASLHWPSRTSPKTPNDSTMSEGNSSSTKDYHEPLDDLECPPSSLPIASSDMDFVEVPPQPSGDADESDGDALDEETQLPSSQQHWPGLPPSSPPAPSSPVLFPEEIRSEYEEMDELPIATSDSETDAEMSVFDADTTFPAGDYMGDTQTGMPCMEFTEEDYHAFFSMNDNPALEEPLDLFEQFINSNPQTDSQQSSSLNSDRSPYVMTDPIDFTEFWETFKPLINDNSHPQVRTEQSADSGYLFTADDSHLAGTNHAKLADNMKALLSGCLM